MTNKEIFKKATYDSLDKQVGNLSCPECHTAVDVWHPSEKLIKEYEKYKEKKNDN